MQVTSLLPDFIAPMSEHVTSTTVPGFTGNCVIVASVLVHSVLSPVHSIGAEDLFTLLSLLPSLSSSSLCLKTLNREKFLRS